MGPCPGMCHKDPKCLFKHKRCGGSKYSPACFIQDLGTTICLSQPGAHRMLPLSIASSWWCYCCRYLYRHNYTLSVPEVYYEINRPDLQALYTNQLVQRDFSRQGSTDTWVQYLTKGNGTGPCTSA